jgi:hypothetical protein
MYSLRSSTMLVLIALGMLVGLLTGCGGGQSGNGSQGGKPAGTKGQGGQAANKPAQQPKTAIGVIKRVKPDDKVLIVRPTTGNKGGKPVIFKVAKNARISLGGKKAGMADVKEGQQAHITYIVVKGRNRAQVVKLNSAQQAKTAIGVIRRVKSDDRVLIVKPRQDGKLTPFKLTKNATITLGGKKAEIADIKEGQQAQITYIVVKDRNRAREVKLFGGGKTSTGGGEKTG